MQVRLIGRTHVFLALLEHRCNICTSPCCWDFSGGYWFTEYSCQGKGLAVTSHSSLSTCGLMLSGPGWYGLLIMVGDDFSQTHDLKTVSHITYTVLAGT